MKIQTKITDEVGMRYVMGAVRRFHDACGIPTPKGAGLPEPSRRALRQRLIQEEVLEELLPALKDNDLEKIADGIADAIYVLIGTALEYGIPQARIWAIVCGANDAKIDPATGFVRRRADGKILKPEGWVSPEQDIAVALWETGVETL